MPRTSQPIKVVILIVSIVLLILFLHFIRVLSPLERGIVYLTKPVMRLTYSLSNKIGDNYLSFRSKQDLLRENKELKDQIAILLKEKSYFENEKEENEFLREQLKFSQTMSYEFVIANVIGKNIGGKPNSLLLDVGTQSGLVVGQPVLGAAGIVVGKISKVENNRSLMTLINDDLSRIAVKIQGRTKTMGVVEGEFGLGLKMGFIPQNEIVFEGDLVVTSGIEENVPANLVVGQIERIKKEPEALFHEATIKSPIDFSKITMVNIVKNK
jgi:rod shape-determining protein MreC